MHARRLFLLALGTTLAAAFSAPVHADESPAGAQDHPDSVAAGFKPLTVEPPDDRDVTGRYGGTITWAEIGEIDTFHPLMSSSATSSELRALVFDSLVGYDNGRWEHVPLLAHRWEHSDDWLTWTFHLRKGVRWSDGEPFTAADVLFSFGTVFNPKFPNSDVDGFRIGDAPLPVLEAPDDHTVVFRLSAVDALFLMHVGNVAIAPRHLWAESAQGDSPSYGSVMGCGEPQKVVGTGPFRIVEYSGAERVVYERNPWSWRRTRDGHRLPFVDRAIVLLVKDLSTRTYQFLNGNFDLITDIPAPDYDQVKAKEKEGSFTLHRLGLSLNTTWISFNQHPATAADGQPFVAPHKLRWFQDRRFRRAMSHAIDRENLVKLFLDGKGEAIYGETTRANKTWYAAHTTFPYDPPKATALLDEMGLAQRDSDGVRTDAQGRRVEIELMTNVENDVRVKVIAQLKADWAKVGVSAILRPVNFNELVSQLEDAHKWECILLGWGSGVPPDPLNGKNIILSKGRLHVWYPKQEKPANAWEAECDALVEAMDKEPDEAKRKPLWATFLELQAEEQPIIYLYAQNSYAASKKRVRNLRPSLLRPSTWYNADELWLEEAK